MQITQRFNENDYLPRGDNVPRYGDERSDFLMEHAEDDDLQFAISKDMAIDTTMTNFARAFTFEKQMFAGDLLAFPKRVRGRNGQWKNRGLEAQDVHTSDIGADRAQSGEIGFAVGETPYFIDTRRLKTLVTDEEIEERGPIDPALEATVLLKHALKLRQEIRIFNLADATSNDTAIGTNWDTSADVHTEINAGKEAMKTRIGSHPTHILFGDHVADALLANTALLPDWNVANALDPGTKMFTLMSGKKFPREAWGMQVMIPDVTFNSAAKGAARTLVRIWDQDCFLFYLDPSNRSMTWAIQPQMLDITIVRWRNDDPGGFYYKAMMKRDEVEATSESIQQLVDVI